MRELEWVDEGWQGAGGELVCVGGEDGVDEGRGCKGEGLGLRRGRGEPAGEPAVADEGCVEGAEEGRCRRRGVW